MRIFSFPYCSPNLFIKIKHGSKILGISPHPSPLPVGEREGMRRKQNVRRKFLELNV
jgi:hypothetical protein